MTGAKLSEVHQLSSAQRRLLIEISKDQMMPLEGGLSDSVMLALLVENTDTIGQDVIEIFKGRGSCELRDALVRCLGVPRLSASKIALLKEDLLDINIIKMIKDHEDQTSLV